MAHFQFRDFVVHHENSPLKVNTDAILLGAAIQISKQNAKVLEVGTGNGAISLMLASRFTNAQITAIEPHLGAFGDAKLNFELSNFASRLSVLNQKLSEHDLNNCYDIIVSNPPYFLDSIQSEDKQINEAKHLSKLKFIDLLGQMTLRLNKFGQLWLILNPQSAQIAESILNGEGMYCTLKWIIHSNPYKLNKRWLLCFEWQLQNFTEKEFFIRSKDGLFSEDYRTLAGAFHYNMI